YQRRRRFRQNNTHSHFSYAYTSQVLNGESDHRRSIWQANNSYPYLVSLRTASENPAPISRQAILTPSIPTCSISFSLHQREHQNQHRKWSVQSCSVE